MVGLACGKLAARLDGVLLLTDEEDSSFENRCCEGWRDRAEVHEIDVISLERVTEVDINTRNTSL